MRFLANENFPRVVIEALRAGGHDVAWVRTEAPGAPGEQVLGQERAEDRVLLTFDKGFGELVLKRGISATRGVVLFRVSLERPTTLARRVVAALASRGDWAGHFSVVEEERVRMRPLTR